MGVEGVAFDVGTNLVAAGLLHTGGLTRERLRGAFREAEFSTELDDVETTFAATLEDSIADVESKRDTGELTGVVGRWDPIVRELYGLEEAAEVGGVDRILFESAEEAIEEIAAAIARAAGFHLANTPGLEPDLKAAVAVAYHDAIGSFVERIGDTVAEQFLVASGVEIHSQLHEIRRAVDDLRERFSRRRYDLRSGNETGRERVVEKLSRELSGPTDAKVEYVPRPELEDYEDDKSLLLLGPGGSGKTRSLIELVRRHEDVAHIVHPRDVFQNPPDADRFVMETFEGDVLLVWDDIHEANPEDENEVVRKAVVELRDLLTPEFELHVLATGRIGQEESIPGDPDDDDGLWGGVERVELAGLGPEVLAQVIVKAIDVYNVAVSREVIEAFHEKALRAEPTPLYIVSVLQNAGDKLTETDIEELPESAIEIWGKNYAVLGENRKRVLRSMKVLGELAPGSVFPKSLLRGVYVEVIPGSKGGFQTLLGTVVNQHWLVENETDNGSVYGMHDVKREAVEQEFERWLVEDLSDFLRTSSRRYFSTVSSSTTRVLHGNLAGRVKEYEWGRDLAAEHYEHILEHINDEDGHICNSYAVLLKTEGNTDAARERFEQAINTDPDYAKARSNYAMLLKEEEETETAKEHLEQAIEAEPSLIPAHINYGLLLLNESQASPAVKRIETAVRLCFNEGPFTLALPAMQTLARANLKAGNRARAIETCVNILLYWSALGAPDEFGEVTDRTQEVLYNHAVDEPVVTVKLGAVTVINRSLTISYRLFDKVWEGREDIGSDLSQVAGVATAALCILLDVGSGDPKAIVADIDPEGFRNPVRAVYDYLSDGETDWIVDDEPSMPEFIPYPHEADGNNRRIEDVPLDMLEAAAFDTLLLRLRNKT